MPRGEIYRAVKGAFVYLYLYLVILGLTALAAALWEEGTARLLLALVAADFAAVLLAKRKLILDLLEGRTETFPEVCLFPGRSAGLPGEDGGVVVRLGGAVVSAPEPCGGWGGGERERNRRSSAPPYKGVVPAEALAGGGIQKAQLCCALPPAAGALLVL